MPRLPRLFAAGQTHHLIQRGNSRSAIFFDDADRRAYLGWLGEALAREGCAPHTSHLVYHALGPTPASQRDAYNALFRHAPDDETKAAIRDATQRS